MGDRTWCQISSRSGDLTKLTKVLHGLNDEPTEQEADELWDELDDQEDGTTFVQEYEVDWGWFDEVNRAAKEGLIFEGSHGPGGEYGPKEFVCMGGRAYWMESDGHGRVLIQVKSPGRPIKGQLAQAKAFYRARKGVQKYLSATTSGESLG